jgi:hypothetical protein
MRKLHSVLKLLMIAWGFDADPLDLIWAIRGFIEILYHIINL